MLFGFRRLLALPAVGARGAFVFGGVRRQWSQLESNQPWTDLQSALAPCLFYDRARTLSRGASKDCAEQRVRGSTHMTYMAACPLLR
jgi:hypothetical protein